MSGQREELVPTIRLDELDLPPGNILLKSDTQGHDLQVIDGAEGLLDRVAAILVETAVRPIYEGSPLLPELLAVMSGRGYELAGLFPVLGDSDGLRQIEFDALFLGTDPAFDLKPSTEDDVRSK